MVGDVETRDLEGLLEVFGSQFSLEDIASAYCKAKRNIDMAGEILCAMDGNTSGNGVGASEDKVGAANSISLEQSSKLDSASATYIELSCDNVLEKSYNGEINTRASKSKKCPVSMGTVSGVIGKEYVRPKPLKTDCSEATKPIKLDSKELPVTEICNEEVPPSITLKNDTMCIDVEDFLFKMLGHGFQLDMTMIREVLGSCGYDVQKTMDKLLDISASTLEKSDDVVAIAAGKSTKKRTEQESLLHQEQLQHLYSAQSDGARPVTRNSTEPPKRDKDRFGLQKEVLEALFSVPERSEEAPKRTRLIREVKRSTGFGKVLVEPYKNTATKHTTVSAEPKEVTGNEDEYDENSFEVLRKAVKEYWVTMKEYYKAAVEAFAKGDHARANTLLEQGHFFNKKAREADEKSVQKLFDARDDEVVSDDVVSLDLHDYKPKDALRLLRPHLINLSGISAIKYLRVIMGTLDEDTTKGARKRLILKQLEKESINWTEEGNSWTILIRVDMINPKNLSFAKKNKY